MKSCYVEYEMENMTCLIGVGLAWDLWLRWHVEIVSKRVSRETLSDGG